MARNYPSGPRNWRGDEGRSNRWRDENEGRYAGGDQDRDFEDQRYAREEEEDSDSAARAGSFDQGRVQYGRRDTREQSGSTGRYAGYGDFGQGDYSGGRRGYTGQERYGQSGYGRGGYGQSRSGEYRGGNYAGDYGRHPAYGDESGAARQGGYGGNYGEGRYGEGGSRSRWNEPYGEGQQYTSRGDYAGESMSRGMGQHRGKGPKGYQRSDERLKEMICERLREDPDIDASEVTVSVQNSRVTLEGTVDSRHTKNLVEDVAEQLGVNDVQNNLRVQRADQSAGSSMTQDRGTATDQWKSKQH
jgi:osmotically-inducible protein OsmY